VQTADNRTASHVLYQLDTDGPARLGELAVAAALIKTSMNQRFQGVEQRGSISRIVDPSDRRATVIVIADIGAAKSSGSVDVASGNGLDELVTALNPNEQAALEPAAWVTPPLIIRVNGAEPKGHSQGFVA
jgi:DNA-binding MarR family transcriptional regulator